MEAFVAVKEAVVVAVEQPAARQASAAVKTTSFHPRIMSDAFQTIHVEPLNGTLALYALENSGGAASEE